MKLAIYLPNHLGDVVVASSLINWYKKSSNYHLTVVIRKNLSPLFRKNPLIDSLIEIPENLMSLKSTISILKNENLDICLILPKSISSALIMWLAKVKVRTGYPFDYRKYFLTDVIPIFDYHSHPLRDFYFNVAKKYLSGSPPVYPDFVIPEPDKTTVLTGDKIKGCVAIDPGAVYGETKSWNDSKWISLIKILEKDMKITLFGIRDLSSWTVNFSNTLNLSCKTSIKDLPYLLSKIKIFISGDTGSMHLAAALGKDTISIFGSSSPKWTSPWGRGRNVVLYKPTPCSPCFKRKCMRKDIKCMENIKIEDVIKNIH